MNYSAAGSQGRSLAKSYNDTLLSRSSAASESERLVMVYATLLKHLMQAQGYMEREMRPAKGESIGRCLDIFICLQSALNHDKGGEIADNLDEIYRYSMVRLLQANRNNDPSLITEITTLVKILKSAWDEIV